MLTRNQTSNASTILHPEPNDEQAKKFESPVAPPPAEQASLIEHASLVGVAHPAASAGCGLAQSLTCTLGKNISHEPAADRDRRDQRDVQL